MTHPETLHPSLWRADQLAQSATRCMDTGFAALSAQLPGGGWPLGTLIDLLVQQHGIGELRLLQPTLAALGKRPIVLLQPPHVPQALALAALGLEPSQLLWVRSGAKASDALWAAEQILRSGCCGALLFWQKQARGETLRRLHLAAQSGETLFCMLRPLSAAQDASPAPLRLSLKPAAGGMDIGFVKRRGPQRDVPLFLPLTPALLQRHAPLDRSTPATAPARSIQPTLVG
ncbi:MULTISPECIES: translesion DNA synthesis-associated protein ImuA [unclassified Duganella]|jgi:protein ImuA|uniref:translesion DNA synthesis-associated protein ImuA n=1 Tax=unclassified Duganella TaxID=2636909 RepID=UPI000891E022|nr:MULTISPECIES: translesion DNA synthesis-associated protein ImuA [unclassified Duganella]SDG04845.1 protein ImuA [Duganella sp. OV458]SDJ00612.1 protein ImuA [Duganella sp. OV510]